MLFMSAMSRAAIAALLAPLLGLFGALPSVPVSADAAAAPAGGSSEPTLLEASMLASAGGLTQRLGLYSAGSRLELGLDAENEGASLSASLDCRGSGPSGAGLVLGPASPSGSLRFLLDPCSASALSGERLISLDSGLDSRRLGLCLEAPPLSAFALGELDKRCAIYRTAGLGSRPEAFEAAPEIEAACAGLSWASSFSGWKLAALASASSRPAGASSSWAPDFGLDPALGDGRFEPGPQLRSAVIGERLWGEGRALFALASSSSRLAGSGLALRLDARESLEHLDLRLLLCAADPAYRGLFGARQARLLGAEAKARLELGAGAALAACLSTEAQGRGLCYAPLWSRAAELSLACPAPCLGIKRLEAGAKLELGTAVPAAPLPGTAAQEPRASFGVSALRRHTGDWGESASRIKARAQWKAGLCGLDVDLDSSCEAPEGLPVLSLGLSLSFLDEGDPSSPPKAGCELAIGLPCGSHACAELSLGIDGVSLSPLAAGTGSPSPEIVLSYSTSQSIGR